MVERPARSRRPFLALLVASCGFVIVLDSFAANVAFPACWKRSPTPPLHPGLGHHRLLDRPGRPAAGGRGLGDRYGRRTVFLVGMALFALFSLTSAAAPGPGWLIASRVVQGCGGALMVSTSIALGIAEYPADKRGLAMGWMGVMGSIASLLGPIVAGNIITIGGSWRLVFLAPVPIAAVTLTFGPRLLSAGRDVNAVREPIDGFGVVLVVAASGLLTLGIQQTGQWGWADSRTVAVLCWSVVLWILFGVQCRLVRFPLLRLSLFTDRPYLVASVSQLGSQMAIFAFFFWTPLYLVNIWGWTASTVGWIVAMPLLVSMTSTFVGKYTDIHGHRAVLVIGGLIGTAGNLWWAFVMSATPRFWSLLPGLLAFGVAISLVGITSAAAALTRIEPANLAVANSAFQTGRRLIQTLGVAVVVALLGDRSTESVDRFRLVWLVSAGAFAFSAVVALWFPPRAKSS
ncbi:MAG: MFS transporter [Acidimicrobiales bacterium]